MKVLCVDLNNTLYRGLHVHKRLSDGPHQTGGLFGFVTQLCAHIKTTTPDCIIVCNDSPPYLRSKLFPEYKKKDQELDSAARLTRMIANENREWILELLSIMKIPVFGVTGLEADDCFAILCQKYSSEHQLTIVSNDADMYQLLSYPNIVLHKNKERYTIDSFEKEYPGINIKDWPTILAVAGTHNAVPGFDGYKETKAIKLFRDKGKWFKFYKENKQEIELYRSLITLPISYIEPPKLTPPKIVERKVINYLAQFRIVYSPPMHNALSNYVLS